MSEKQIFIVGTGRSGTSILKKILSRHSEIYTYPKELRFIADINGLMDLRRALTTDWNPHNASSTIESFVDLMTIELFQNSLYEKVLNRLFVKVLSGSGRRYASVRMGDFMPFDHLKKCLDIFLRNLGIESIPGYWYGSKSYKVNPELYFSRPLDTEVFDKEVGKFTDHLLSYPLKEADASCWCDDTPMNILYADIFPLMFVDVKIIHLYRNPLDVIASYADPGQSWAPNNPELAAYWVADILNKWKEVRSNLPSYSYLEINYESLIQDQEKGLRKVMAFLGVEFQDSLMDIQLNDNSVGRYKADIPQEQLVKVRKILRPIMKELGCG